MALSLTDVEKIAKLSRLSLTEEEKGKTLSELNDIFAMVEKMRRYSYRNRPCRRISSRRTRSAQPPVYRASGN